MAKDPNNLLYGPRRRGPGPNTNRRPQDLQVSEIDTWTDAERESFSDYFAELLGSSIDYLNQRHEYTLDAFHTKSDELMVVVDKTNDTGFLIEVRNPDGLYTDSDKLVIEVSQRRLEAKGHWITDYESELIDINELPNNDSSDEKFFIEFIILPALAMAQMKVA